MMTRRPLKAWYVTPKMRATSATRADRMGVQSQEVIEGLLAERHHEDVDDVEHQKSQDTQAGEAMEDKGTMTFTSPIGDAFPQR